MSNFWLARKQTKLRAEFLKRIANPATCHCIELDDPTVGQDAPQALPPWNTETYNGLESGIACEIMAELAEDLEKKIDKLTNEVFLDTNPCYCDFD